jgi:hypothetical protein
MHSLSGSDGASGTTETVQSAAAVLVRWVLPCNAELDAERRRAGHEGA